MADGRKITLPASWPQILEKHIKTVVGHYHGKIFAWDVVNEAFDELRPGELREHDLARSAGIGLAEKRQPTYIERCFRWAHEADPQALLFYNEAEAETVNPKSDAIYAMVRDFPARGVPIDGVGLQMHIRATCTPILHPSPPISSALRLGVQVHITEMDVALPVDQTAMPAPRICNCRRISIVILPALACRIRGARRSRPGDSRISIHGLDRTRSRRKERRCRLTETIGPSLRMKHCGMRWRQGVVSRRSVEASASDRLLQLQPSNGRANDYNGNIPLATPIMSSILGPTQSNSR